MATTTPRFVPPQPFTRVAHPSGPLTSYYRRPHDPATRRTRDLSMLLALLPRLLTPALSERFNPARRPFVWSAPPTRASFARRDYAPADLTTLKDVHLCGAITSTAGLIEWLLEAPEEAVGGLNRTYLLLVQMHRLRQLWQEAQRRAWPPPAANGGPQDSLKTFARALG